MFVLLWLFGLVLLASGVDYSVLCWCLVCLLGGYCSLFCGVLGVLVGLSGCG